MLLEVHAPSDRCAKLFARDCAVHNHDIEQFVSTRWDRVLKCMVTVSLQPLTHPGGTAEFWSRGFILLFSLQPHNRPTCQQVHFHLTMPVGRLLGASKIIFVLLSMGSVSASSPVWYAQELYDYENCTGTPSSVSMASVSECNGSQCTSVTTNSSTSFVSLECDITDRFAYAEEVYGEFNYIIVEDYQNAGCEDLVLTTVISATGSCSMSSPYGSYSIIAALFANGSAAVALYNDQNCDGEAYLQVWLDSGNISSGECIRDYYKVYTSASESMSSSSGVTGSSTDSSAASAATSYYGYNSIAIVCIILAATAVGVLIAIYTWNRRSSSRNKRSDPSECIVDHEESYSSLRNAPKSTILSTGSNRSYGIERREQRSISYFWDDEELATVRIDREKVVIGEVISQGAYGQVLRGSFNGKRVAVKMLLPENRKNVKHLNAFLEEVKLMARLDHPRIVKFIGVAWDSLADICVLTEFMRGGDLRKLLDSYEARRVPLGFNETKVTIALHVAHALTYLHSLDPPVLHRDLKSRNILLSTNLSARITDFGVSREHVDNTMTAGVGTSRWMAPEVMMGERYDDKADVFSLGIVLSELDTHGLPYSHVKDNNNPGRKMPSTMIAHLVASGKLQVRFSSVELNAITELGIACVAVDPNDRPTAAQALYKLHIILTNEFRRESSDISVGYL